MIIGQKFCFLGHRQLVERKVNIRWLMKALLSNRFLYFQEIFLDKGQKAFIVVLVFQTEHIVANYRRPRFEGIQSKIDSKGIEIGHLRLLSSALGPIFLLSWKIQNKQSHYQLQGILSLCEFH